MMCLLGTVFRNPVTAQTSEKDMVTADQQWLRFAKDRDRDRCRNK